MNKWISNFMTHLRKFYLNDDLAFVYNDISKEFGVAAADIKVVNRGKNREYFSSDFEKILSKHWEHSPSEQLTRIEMYANDGVLYFAKRTIFDTHYCDINCPVIMKKFRSHYDMVVEAHRLDVKDVVIKRPTTFDIKSAAHGINVLVEFQEVIFGDTVNKEYKLKFKKLSDREKTPVRATEGSVGYDLYNAVYKSISPQICKAIATDIAWISPRDIYPGVAPCSSLAIKNTDVGAGVIDLDYRGNLKVVIMNHSVDTHLHMDPGDRIAQFIMTRFQTTELEEVVDVDATERGQSYFGSTGH